MFALPWPADTLYGEPTWNTLIRKQVRSMVVAFSACHVVTEDILWKSKVHMIWLRAVQEQVPIVPGLFDGAGVQRIALFPHLLVIGIGGQCSCPGVWRFIALWPGRDPEEVGCGYKRERDV